MDIPLLRLFVLRVHAKVATNRISLVVGEAFGIFSRPYILNPIFVFQIFLKALEEPYNCVQDTGLEPFVTRGSENLHEILSDSTTVPCKVFP